MSLTQRLYNTVQVVARSKVCRDLLAWCPAGMFSFPWLMVTVAARPCWELMRFHSCATWPVRAESCWITQIFLLPMSLPMVAVIFWWHDMPELRTVATESRANSCLLDVWAWFHKVPQELWIGFFSMLQSIAKQNHGSCDKKASWGLMRNFQKCRPAVD